MLTLHRWRRVSGIWLVRRDLLLAPVLDLHRLGETSPEPFPCPLATFADSEE